MLKVSLTTWSGKLLIALSTVVPTVSWVPPRSAENPTQVDPNYEPVQAMRKRLGIEYNYTPSILHPEMCRFVSPEECQDIDGNLQRHAQSHRRRQLQASRNPSLGKVKVLVLLIQFSDHTQDRVLIDRSQVENVWKTEVKPWFSENSQGAYEVDPVVVDWVVTDNTEVYYAFDTQGRTPELQFAMYPALKQLDEDPNWDWSQFDVDGDGELDAVMMMHSGFDAVVAAPDCKGREDTRRIFPHAYSTSSEDTWTSSDGSVSLNAYAVASAYNGLCDGEPFTIGLTCHEYMHTLGLIDLYNVANPAEAEGVGLWDIMSNPYGDDNTGNAGFLSAWSRKEVNWVAPEQITYDGIYVLKPAETSAQAYQLSINPFAFAPEYILIENRQQISYDANLWDSGLMIYHIDDAANGMESRGYPEQEGWPGNGNHYRVAVLPKDGRYDLEQNINAGDAGDMWLPGDELGPGMGNTVFPNTDSYQGGFIIESGITIRVLSQAANKDVVFEVTGLAPAPAGTTTTPTPPEVGEEPAATTQQPSISPPEPATPAPTVSLPEPATLAPTVAPVAASTPAPTTPVPAQATPEPTMIVPEPATPAPSTPEPATASPEPDTPEPGITSAAVQPEPATPMPTNLVPGPGTPEPMTAPPEPVTAEPGITPTTVQPVSTDPPTIVAPQPATPEPATTPPATTGAAPEATTKPIATPTKPPVVIPVIPASTETPGRVSEATMVFEASENLRYSAAFSSNKPAMWRLSLGVAIVLLLC